MGKFVNFYFKCVSFLQYDKSALAFKNHFIQKLISGHFGLAELLCFLNESSDLEKNNGVVGGAEAGGETEVMLLPLVAAPGLLAVQL